MAVEIVQADHDVLANISQRFDDQSDQVRAQYDKIMQQLQVLQNGAWEGPNADKAFEIFEGTLLPAVQRLSKALDQASQTTKQVSKMMKDSDEEMKGLFPA